MPIPRFAPPGFPDSDGSLSEPRHYPANYGPGLTITFFREKEMAKLQAETVQSWAREVQDLELSSARAAALAAMLEPLAAAAAAARRALPFDCEPALFLRAQQRWQGEEP
jgi:phosphoribosylamine-glycine ligase